MHTLILKNAIVWTFSRFMAEVLLRHTAIDHFCDDSVSDPGAMISL